MRVHATYNKTFPGHEAFTLIQPPRCGNMFPVRRKRTPTRSFALVALPRDPLLDGPRGWLSPAVEAGPLLVYSCYCY
jgi:hypothetical protein